MSLPVASKRDLPSAEALPALQYHVEMHAQSKGDDTIALRHLSKVVVLS